jgi:hypothetical protein
MGRMTTAPAFLQTQTLTSILGSGIIKADQLVRTMKIYLPVHRFPKEYKAIDTSPNKQLK